MEAFKERITDTLKKNDFTFFRELIEGYLQETQVSALDLAAALAGIAQGNTPFFLKESPAERRPERKESERSRTFEKSPRTRIVKKRAATEPEQGMDRYRIEVGLNHGVKPGNIVGAIANEAEISSEHMGRISIFDDHSTIDLPFGMPDDILRLLKKVRINERMLKISRLDAPRHTPGDRPEAPRKAGNGSATEGIKIRRRGQKKSTASPSAQF